VNVVADIFSFTQGEGAELGVVGIRHVGKTRTEAFFVGAN
jgi:hypothetical protein